MKRTAAVAISLVGLTKGLVPARGLLYHIYVLSAAWGDPLNQHRKARRLRTGEEHGPVLREPSSRENGFSIPLSGTPMPCSR